MGNFDSRRFDENFFDLDWRKMELFERFMTNLDSRSNQARECQENRQILINEYPIHVIARDGQCKTMTFICETSYDLNQSHDQHGLIPLQWACRRGHLKLVQLLKAVEYSRWKKAQNTINNLCWSLLNPLCGPFFFGTYTSILFYSSSVHWTFWHLIWPAWNDIS